jgi:hypothetical protein
VTRIYQVAKPVYRALQLLNKLANGRIFRSDAQPQVDNVDVWGTLDDSLQTDAQHAVFITNFNVSCDAKPLPARQLNLTLRTSPACTPSHVTVYTIDDVNGAPPAATPLPIPPKPFPPTLFPHPSPQGPNPRAAWTGMGRPQCVPSLRLCNRVCLKNSQSGTPTPRKLQK